MCMVLSLVWWGLSICSLLNVYPGEESAQLWACGSATAWFGKLLLDQERCWVQRAQPVWAVPGKAFPQLPVYGFGKLYCLLSG